MVFEMEEMRGRFAGLSGKVVFSRDVRGRFFDPEATGLHWTNCTIVERVVVGVVERKQRDRPSAFYLLI